MTDNPVQDWTPKDVELWLVSEGLNLSVIQILIRDNSLDGKCLLALTENDFYAEPLSRLSLHDRKYLYVAVKQLQRSSQNAMIDLGLLDLPSVTLYSSHQNNHNRYNSDCGEYLEAERVSPPLSDEVRVQRLPPEIWKAFLAFCYVVVVTWITAFVMVIVHDRVPDMKKYPPLPDIFLDNVPHIPWAFDMCEVTGTFLFTIWLIVLLFHKHR